MARARKTVQLDPEAAPARPVRATDDAGGGRIVSGPPGSEFLSRVFARYDVDGAVSNLFLVLKRAYDLRNGARAVPSPAPEPIVEADALYFGADPLKSSVARESDLTAPKVATDVVVKARAYAPEGGPVTELTCSVEVERYERKEVLVIGDRAAVLPAPDSSLTYREVRFTKPLPFVQMPLRYERAYGGQDGSGGEAAGVPYMKNPTGTGYIAKLEERPDGYIVSLPNLEDPENRLEPKRFEVDPNAWDDWPAPAGFDWIPRYWLPRASLAGNPDPGVPLEELFPNGVPEGATIEWTDPDPRYLNGAAPGLAVGPLTGSERVVCTNMHRTDPRYAAQLPGDRPMATWDPGDGEERMTNPMLATVVIDLESERLVQVWSAECVIAGVTLPGWVGKIRVRVVGDPV